MFGQRNRNFRQLSRTIDKVSREDFVISSIIAFEASDAFDFEKP